MIKTLYPYWYETYTTLEQQGLSQRKIAKEMGIHRTTLQHWLKNPNKVEAIPQEEIKPSIDDMIAKAALWEAHKEYERKMIRESKKENTGHENQRILLISDMHIPYNHRDLLPFLTYLNAKYKPTRVICLGDECDLHALSYHDSSPDLSSAGDELTKALPIIAEIHKLFPIMDILESNHGSLVWRKAKTHGIPKRYIKSYNEVLCVGDGWKWHDDLLITLPNGNKCYLHHGKVVRGLTLSEKMGCCSVQGHHHEQFNIGYYGTPFALNWALQCGCLIDYKSYAFSYANVNIKRQVIGTGLILDSQPVLVPLLMDENGAWVKPADYDEVMRGQP